MFFFSLYVFWRTSGPFFTIFSSVAPHRGQPAAKCHPRWQPTRRWTISCGLGRHRIRTRDYRTTVWRTTIEPPRLHFWATTPPLIEPPRLHYWATTPPQLSHHASTIEPPRLHHWATTPPMLQFGCSGNFVAVAISCIVLWKTKCRISKCQISKCQISKRWITKRWKLPKVE